jgi:hypothetical protein
VFKTLTADALRTLIVHAFRTRIAVEGACIQGETRHVYFKSKVYSDQLKTSKDQGSPLDEPCHTQAQSKVNRWTDGLTEAYSRYSTRDREAVEHRRTKKKISPLYTTGDRVAACC